MKISVTNDENFVKMTGGLCLGLDELLHHEFINA